MNPCGHDKSVAEDAALITELLVLPDGRILVHNLTPAFAGLLSGLNPDDEQLASRALARGTRNTQSEFPS